MEIKVGDKVIYTRGRVSLVRTGTVVKIKYQNSTELYFYSVLDDRDDDTIALGWSCNIFPHMGDTIELDKTRMRDEKLNDLIC